MHQYEDIVWPSEEVTMVPTGGKMREGVDSVERVKIRYNGMSRGDHQTVADNQHSAVDSKMYARGLSATQSSIWKVDPTQQDTADKSTSPGYAGVSLSLAKTELNASLVASFRLTPILWGFGPKN